ncbi:MAG: hypothetical protein E7646_02175 [Ruminococcaceae bacterium]|nr:hypothetical protein [Oscillospiraceae bacterium]
MKRLFSLFLILFFLSSCSPQAADGNKGGTAVLFSSLSQIWLEAGGTVDVTVQESIDRGFAEKGTPLVDTGAGKQIDTEALIALSPELCIYSLDVPAQVDCAKLLESCGIRTLGLRVESYGEYLSALKQMCAILGDNQAYSNALSKKEQIDNIISSSPGNGKSFVFIRCGSSAASVKTKGSADHFAAAMLTELGLENIADKDANLLNMGIEAIIASDPDYIFFSTMGDENAAVSRINELLSRDTLQSLSAVKEGKVTILPKELFHYKPNSRWTEAYQYLRDCLK